MAQNRRATILEYLFRSLDKRPRPEQVAGQISGLLDLSSSQQAILKEALRSEPRYYSSMSEDFHQPIGMRRQLDTAAKLFGAPFSCSVDDTANIKSYVEEVDSLIDKKFGGNDFKFDRLSKAERLNRGIDISRRQYNKLFRTAVRLEQKLRRFEREKLKRAMTLASKNRLAADITWEDFSSDLNTACFIAYYVSRCNLRSVFTNSSQVRPFDEICEMLFQRCYEEEKKANWWAIAHVLPDTDVLEHLSDERKGTLLAAYYGLLIEAAGLLAELWDSRKFNDDFIVQSGDDSSTWNLAAGAWNKLREGWFSLTFALGMADVTDRLCPGKVLRLMAADVAAWHRMSGGTVHADTFVWQELPRPWNVVAGNVDCPKTVVEGICRKHGVDPVKSGWIAPKPQRAVVKFTPTPELVHGVEVSSPQLAGLLRRAGVFSGKHVKENVPGQIVDHVRARHWAKYQRQRDSIDR